MKIQRNVKIILGIYIGTFLFACCLSYRMQRLGVKESLRNTNHSMVLYKN